MAYPPKLHQKRYRMRLRWLMVSAKRHLDRLYKWDQKFRTQPCTVYPQQLCVETEAGEIGSMATLLGIMLDRKGPIPNRANCPTT